MPERGVRRRPRGSPSQAGSRARAGGIVLVLALALSSPGCGDTVQDQPIAHNALEALLVAPFRVFWLGRSFHGLAITETGHDPSGAFSVQYGDCKLGGQGTCVPPLRVISSPDNSFLPGASAPHALATIRGVSASLTRGGRDVAISSGGVVVTIHALDPRLAAAAAQSAVPINDLGAPGAPLPAPQPDTGFAETPLPAQVPAPLAAPPRAGAAAPRSSCVSRRTCGRSHR